MNISFRFSRTFLPIATASLLVLAGGCQTNNPGPHPTKTQAEDPKDTNGRNPGPHPRAHHHRHHPVETPMGGNPGPHPATNAAPTPTPTPQQ